jgi:cell division topological specificity factor
MNFISFFRRPATAPVARDRLKLLLAHERVTAGNADLVALLREEIVAVLARHFPVDADAIKVRMETGEAISTLEVEVEIPTPVCAEIRLKAANFNGEAGPEKKKADAVSAVG